MTKDQQEVRMGMAAAAMVSLIWVWMGYKFFAPELPLWNSIGDRLAFVIKCDLFAVFMLLFGIGSLAGQRFYNKTAIDGQRDGLPPALEINLRYCQNTLEQLVLLIMAHLAFATTASGGELKLIPVLVSLFIFGRITFWIGYHRGTVSRAFGFAVTFYPTIVMMLYAGWRIL